MRSVLPALGIAAVVAWSARGESAARFWNEEILAAIRIDIPHPPAHARNLFHLSVAMYDAWAVYDPLAVGCLYQQKHEPPGDREAARHEAVSFAAYRILSERYALSVGAATSLPRFTQRLGELGYSHLNTSTDPATPAGVGNRVAAAISSACLGDGSRQANGYADHPVGSGGYVYINTPPLEPALAGASPVDVNRWHRLKLITALSQNGIPTTATQNYLGPHWREVRPFALEREVALDPWVDPGPPPFLGQGNDAAFWAELISVISFGAQLDPNDGVRINISPGAMGNSPLGTNDGFGHPFNPATGQIYFTNSVLRADFTRVLAEYWADGPQSETPPGHWNSLANSVVSHPDFQRRLGGQGEELGELEWDVKMYFALNAALHDAACAAWTIKRHYDGWRPISAIRYLAGLGQSSDPGGPSYHPLGLPLVPDLIEVVTAATAAAGQRHAGLSPGRIALRTYGGPPDNPITQIGGVRWIHGRNWMPFQKTSFVTPGFPGYVSGHSTFSRAAAVVLTALTGSPFFPGGLGEHTVPAFSFTMERMPAESITLQWATYFDAADQAGLSRIWGGIHPPADDFGGRWTGQQVGECAWTLAHTYWDGSILDHAHRLDTLHLTASEAILRAETLRGFHYTFESAPAPEGPYTELAPGAVCLDTRTTLQTTAPTGTFFRVVRRLAP
jgi:hypothetical protein